MDIKTAIRNTSIKLQDAGIEHFNMEARILLKHALFKPEEYLLCHPEEEISIYILDQLNILVARRINLEPIAYITGEKEFYGRCFCVSPDVLIPRPDSEILIDAILSSKKKNAKILDLGTGSGCLIITLMLELEGTMSTAIDLKKEAIEIAQKNASRYLVNIDFIVSNWFDSLKNDQKFDIIISNPPYIDRASDKISKETLLHEPYSALFADNNGLKDYEIIAANASKFLANDGNIYLEIGYDQEEKVIDIYEKYGFILDEKYLDLSGITRCLKLHKAM